MNAWHKPPDSSRQERTGFRDEAISRRHRTWGFNCPARDIDFLMVESDKRLPVALVDYKHVNASESEVNSREHEPIINMADKCEIPFFIVLYDDVRWWFTVIPKNKFAKEITKTVTLTEHDYVWFQYELRGRDFFTDNRVDRSKLLHHDNDNNTTTAAAS